MGVKEEKQAISSREAQNASAAPGDSNEESLVTDGIFLPDLGTPQQEEPPAYGEHHDHVSFSQPGFDAGAEVTSDGRVDINLHTKNRRLADLLAPAIARQISVEPQSQGLPPAYIPPGLGPDQDKTPPPKLNIVVQIVGSRGDVQPFVALGKVLHDTYGHRIRIATHPNFKSFVEENGLEFFSIGGDPAELMAFMVKHPGLMPGMDALKSGEITKRRKGIQEMLLGCWRSCIEAGDGMGPPPKPHRTGEPLDVSQGMPGDTTKEPFVADAIIANPPSFAHIHVAEKLGIPLHMMFTMPWSPTRAFPHPLANIKSSNADDVMTNYMTYTLVEMMTWQGLGDIINRFREKALNLPTLSFIWAPGVLNRLRIPYTYCWSPALIPKPNDWGKSIDISGFYFLNLASSFTPDSDLAAFLEAGPPPVYIGFGSIVVDDPNAMTRMIFDAIHLSGVRALVSKGWGGLGADDVGVPDGVFMLGNVPHDWLFQHVSSVVHHGGAGTTAAGIKAGKPTLVVPFFGDQPFWGSMIARAKAGPEPIRYKDLTAEKLAEAIKFCLEEGTQQQAKELGEKIREEPGTEVGAQSFHSHLNIDAMRCSIAPSRNAVWRVRRSKIRLSPLAATTLVEQGIIEYKDLKLYRAIEYITDDQPPDPVSAGAASLIGDITGIGMAISDVPRDIFKSKRSKGGAADEASSAAGSSATKPTNETTESLNQTISGSEISTPPPPNQEAQQMDASKDDQDKSALSKETSVSQQFTQETASEAAESNNAESLSNQASQAKSESKLPRTNSSGFNIDAALSASQSAGRVVTTGVKSPMNFCLGLAKGFRNIPRLYNDDTVRPIEKVTGFNSGLKVAGKEFGYGFYDGISGLVTQPIRGAEKEGFGGFVKGIGKGIGGLIAKPGAGVWGISAYTMQGVYAEVNKLFARSVSNYIITSRIVQGHHDFATSTEGEREDVVRRWHTMNADLKGFYGYKGKQKRDGKAPASDSAHLGSSEKDWKGSSSQTASVTDSGNMGDKKGTQLEADPELERAIQASVRQTSKGDADEDAAVEEAIRGSIVAMKQQGSMPGILPEKSGQRSGEDPSIFEDEQYRITDEEYQSMVEEAIKKSLAGQFDTDEDSHMPQSSGFIETKVPEEAEHDAQLRQALEESKNAPTLPPRYEDDNDEDLKRAIEASKAEHGREESQKTEEDIVLQYIKKQSLAEEEYRQQFGHGKGKTVDSEAGKGDDNDEEMKRAMEESLRLSKGGDESGPS